MLANDGFSSILCSNPLPQIRINDTTLRGLRTGFSGDMVDFAGSMRIEPDASNIVSQLHGFVRNGGTLTKITEESVLDSESDTSSFVGAPSKAVSTKGSSDIPGPEDVV